MAHLLLARTRAKSPRQFLRAAAVRVWPMSVLARTYYRLRWTPQWRMIANASMTKSFAKNPPALNAEQSRCLAEVRGQGISLTSLVKITGDDQLLHKIQTEAQQILANPDLRKQIEQRRAEKTSKWYVIRGLGYGTQITLPDSFADLLLHPCLLAIVNHYLGQYSRLGYANLWYNLPVGEDEPPIDSECWHRDHEDQRQLKLFCYVEPVDEMMGPFNYIRGTQPNGAYANVFPAKPPLGSYPKSGELEKVIPTEAQIVCNGPAGTVVLCDSTGFHRGGRSMTKPRILLVATYVSNSGLDQRRIDLSSPIKLKGLPLSAKFALHQERLAKFSSSYHLQNSVVKVPV